MTDPMKQAWNDVAETFTNLAKAMKDHYERFEHEDASEEAARPDVSGVRAALDRVVDAGRELGDRIAGTVAGDDVKSQAKQALHALNQAFSTTVEIVGDQLNSVVRRSPLRSREPSSADAHTEGEAHDAVKDATDPFGSSPGASVADSSVGDAEVRPQPPLDRDGLGTGAFGDPLT